MVALVETATPVVDTVKVAEVLPPGTVTDEPTTAVAVLLDSFKTMPPEEAREAKVTVPVEEDPPVTVAGLISTVKETPWVIVNVAEEDELPSVAVIFALVCELTVEVLIVNDTVVAPDSTVTVAGTVAAALPLVRVTTVPEIGAGALSVTTAAAVAPAVTLVGVMPTELTANGSIVSAACFDLPPRVPTISAVVLAPTDVVSTTKVTVVCPEGTVAEADTVAAALPVERATTVPPVGAAPESVIVPVEDAPPITAAGLSVTDERDGAAAAKHARQSIEIAKKLRFDLPKIWAIPRLSKAKYALRNRIGLC